MHTLTVSLYVLHISDCVIDYYIIVEYSHRQLITLRYVVCYYCDVIYASCDPIYLRDTNHMDQSDIGFILPGLWQASPSLDLYAIHATVMTLCHAFLNRHLWQGMYSTTCITCLLLNHLNQIRHGQLKILMKVTRIVQELYSMGLM